VYFYPWYFKSVGVERTNETAILGEDVAFKPNLTYFLQVKLESKRGNLIAFPITGNGSGDLASLVKADAFVELPADKMEFKKGEVYPIVSYRSF
jgi:molybdopterin molybdotransferase